MQNLEYQNQQLKKEVKELKSQVECLLENDSKKGERIRELRGKMEKIIDYYEMGG